MNGWFQKCTNRKRLRAEVIKTKEKRATEQGGEAWHPAGFQGTIMQLLAFSQTPAPHKLSDVALRGTGEEETRRLAPSTHSYPPIPDPQTSSSQPSRCAFNPSNILTVPIHSIQPPFFTPHTLRQSCSDLMLYFGSQKSQFCMKNGNPNRVYLLVITFGGNTSSENDRTEK